MPIVSIRSIGALNAVSGRKEPLRLLSHIVLLDLMPLINYDNFWRKKLVTTVLKIKSLREKLFTRIYLKKGKEVRN